MNQILMFRTADDSKEQLKKVVKFFSVCIIIFGIVFIVEGVLGYLKLKDNRAQINLPEITVNRADKTTKVNVKSNDGISTVKYYWKILEENKKGKLTEMHFGGTTEATVEINALNGTNDLYIEVLDGKGNIIKYEPITITYNTNAGQPENGGSGSGTEENNGGATNTPSEQNWEEAVANDKTKPTVKIEANSGKIDITATDNLKMSYIKYKWNDEEENTVTGLSDDEKTVSATIDVPEGENKLTIIAIDRAGNEERIEKDIKGVKGPSIRVVKENGQIVVNISDDDKITKIIYNYNGEEKTIEDINEKTYEFRLDMIDGTNYILLEAYRDEVKSVYKGRTVKE